MTSNSKIDSQSRKWNITINNPDVKGYSHECIIEICNNFKSLIYMCLSDEIGDNGTFHTHIYIHFSSAVRFSTIQNKFNGGHFEMARGLAVQNRDYVFKEGKWLTSSKGETNLRDTHFEMGELPLERGQGHRSDLDDLYDMIKSGMSDYDIITECPSYISQIDRLDKVRQTIRNEQFKNVFRNVNCTYVFGKTGTGKTRDIMLKYGYSNVYRVTDYHHPFDGYNGQDIIVFDEFRSSLPLASMLMYLEGHPCELPARYGNKVACYTNVYIVSNISLNMQFVNVQRDEIETYNAFLRRISLINEYTSNGVQSYKPSDSKWVKTNKTPFEKNVV